MTIVRENGSDRPVGTSGDVALSLRGAELRFGDRVLWSGLDLDIGYGEFVAVLGANGAGKTSLLRTLLGLQPLTAGTLTVAGRSGGRGQPAVGYIPQQRRIDPLTPMRVRDVVRSGLDGHRWGIARPGGVDWPRVDRALERVGAEDLADVPVGVLSGGEQQRVRIAQALVTDRRVLLCDEPLLSLDPAAQQRITALIDRHRRDHDAAVVFVTHEINPVLPYVDRVVYFAGGRFRIGTVDEVMTASALSELYGAPVEVLHAGGRLVVIGTPDDGEPAHHVHRHDVEEGHG